MKFASSLSFAISVIFTFIPASFALSQGDPDAGKAKSATCVACHGEDGNSTLNPAYPKIGGQIEGYIASSIAAYQSGKRQDPVMQGMIGSLSEQDIADLAAYYSQFELTPASIDEADLSAANSGREIYRIGAAEYSVPACMACHGPAGKGIPARYPAVAGQQYEYLVKTLMDYKSGARVSEEMNPIAFRLTEEQMRNLAKYMHALN